MRNVLATVSARNRLAGLEERLAPFVCGCLYDPQLLAHSGSVFEHSRRPANRLTEILMDRPEQQTRALDCPETLIAGAKWIHRTFVETSKPPPLKDDLADLDGSRLVHKLLAALERQADLQGIFERGDHRDRMRHLGLIGAYLKARASDQQTDTPKLFVTAIRELRKADAARKYLMDLIAPLFTPRVRSPH